MGILNFLLRSVSLNAMIIDIADSVRDSAVLFKQMLLTLSTLVTEKIQP